MYIFNPFWLIFAGLSLLVMYCNRRYCMLKDASSAARQPYSWARVQLAWWSVIVLTSFISILIEYHKAPELWQSTVILLGISAATITTARMIDISDAQDPVSVRHQDDNGSHFFLDILSDGNSVSIHRFQTVIFNLVFGIFFLGTVANHLTDCALADGCINKIMPDIAPNNLILLGLSSATYAALKFTENKPTQPAGNTLGSTVPGSAANTAEPQITEEPPVG